MYYKPIDLQNGVFAKWQVSTDSAARIAVADFNGDGRLDFASIGYSVAGYYETENPSIVIHYNNFAPLPNPIKEPIKNVEPIMVPDHSCQKNSSQVLEFAREIPAIWLRNYDQYHIEGRTIAINLGTKPYEIAAKPMKKIWPRTSTILENVVIHNVDRVLLFPLKDKLDTGKVILEQGWNQLGEIADFDREVALYKSMQYDLGNVRLDPIYATGQDTVERADRMKNYNLRVNIWYCPSKTDCLLHHVHASPHDFMEVHTQIYGIGRMQKFHDNEKKLIYEDDILGPGNTHVIYAGMDRDGEFFYPWH